LNTTIGVFLHAEMACWTTFVARRFACGSNTTTPAPALANAATDFGEQRQPEGVTAGTRSAVFGRVTAGADRRQLSAVGPRHWRIVAAPVVHLHHRLSPSGIDRSPATTPGHELAQWQGGEFMDEPSTSIHSFTGSSWRNLTGVTTNSVREMLMQTGVAVMSMRRDDAVVDGGHSRRRCRRRSLSAIGGSTDNVIAG
jgi:hypothetical protein